MELLRRYRRFPRRRPLLPGIPEVMVALSLPGIPEVTAFAGGCIEGRLCRISLDSRGPMQELGLRAPKITCTAFTGWRFVHLRTSSLHTRSCVPARDTLDLRGVDEGGGTPVIV